jgi:hypothetical protein
MGGLIELVILVTLVLGMVTVCLVPYVVQLMVDVATTEYRCSGGASCGECRSTRNGWLLLADPTHPTRNDSGGCVIDVADTRSWRNRRFHEAVAALRIRICECGGVGCPTCCGEGEEVHDPRCHCSECDPM